jgi:hypothetical protein
VKRIIMCAVSACAFLAYWSPRAAAQDEQYSGTIIRKPSASYVLQMDDGKLLGAKWTSDDDGWSIGDRVILTTENGEGFMFNEDRRTEVDVFLYNASETGDEEE